MADLQDGSPVPVVAERDQSPYSLRTKLILIYILASVILGCLLWLTKLDWRHAVLEMLVMFSVMALLGRVIILHFVAPLRSWTADAQQFSEQAASARIDVVGDDADRDFALAFNELLNRSEQTQESLKQQLREYEEILQMTQAEHEASQRRLHHFLNEIGDHIRSPLNAVIGLAQIFGHAHLTVRQRDYLQKIQTSGQASLDLVNDVHDYVQLKYAQLELDQLPFVLEEVLMNLAQRTHASVISKDIEYVFNIPRDLPLKLTGDAYRFEQVLFNLLSKSIELSARSAAVELRVSHQRSAAKRSYLRFDILSSGILPSERQQEALLAVLGEGDAESRSQYLVEELGLNIARRLANLMDANLLVSRDSGTGLLFEFALEMEIAEDLPQLPQATGLNHARILVVDDHASARRVLTAALEGLLCDVDTADSASAALELLYARQAQAPFDLLMIDRQMPGMDGLELIRKIKADKHLMPMPKIILLTPFGREDMLGKAARLGIQAILQKPVNQSRLLDTLFKVFCGEDALQKHEHGHRPHAYYPELRTLIIDDNLIDQQIATEILKQHGIVVDTMPDLQSVLQQPARPQPYQLLMMALPDLAAYDADGIAQLRQHLGSEHLPVIAMTSHLDFASNYRDQIVGIQDYLSKPLRAQKLATLLLRYFGAGQPEPAHARADKQSKPDAGPVTVDVNTEVKSEPKPASRKFYVLGTASSESAINPDNHAGVRLPDFTEIKAAQGIVMMGGKLPLYLKALKKFESTQGRTVAEIASLILRQDYDQAERLTHTLKVLASTIAAPKVELATHKLEIALQARHKTTVQIDYAPGVLALQQAMTALLTELRSKLGPLPASDPANSSSY